jgi:MFS transporter, ACS family, pantothenate transporter
VIGYTLGQIPSNIALTFIPPRIWFSAMQFSWALFCLGQFASKNVQTVMALRFLMGLTEASTFVGMHFIFGSWYKPTEIGKRAALFTTCAQIGSMLVFSRSLPLGCTSRPRSRPDANTSGISLSGFIQGGLYQTMNGRGGLQGWQWLFVIDFVISMPVVIFGFLQFPDFPHNTRCRWFSEEEKQLCVARLPNQNVERPRWLSAATWKRFASSWQFFAFPVCLSLPGSSVRSSHTD